MTKNADKPSSRSQSFLLVTAVLLPLAGLLGALLFLEALTRLLDFDAPPREWSDRPVRYLHHEAAETLQDVPHSVKKDPGTFRIAVVGDSFSFAPYMQFDDAFPKRIERYLNLNSKQPKVEVINYGVPRYSTSHEVAVAERALAEDADLIILQITLNDPEIKPYRPTGLIPEVKGSRQDRSEQVVLEGGIYDYSRFIRWVMTRFYNRKSRKEYYDYFYALFNRPETWNSFKDSLRSIVRLAREKEKPIVAVVFPLFGYPNDDHYPFHPIHQKVSGLLGDLKVAHLDLFDAYKYIPLERLMVMPGKDRHPNEIAHRLAAEHILNLLERERVVPSEVIPKGRVAERISIVKPAPAS